MKAATRVAATAVAAAAVGIGHAGPAAATTHTRPGSPSQDSASATARTAAKSRQGGRLFERIEDAVDKALGIPDNDDP